MVADVAGFPQVFKGYPGNILALATFTANGSNTSTSSTTFVTADTAGSWEVSFTVPQSGKVLVRLSAYADTNNVSYPGGWGLRDKATGIDVPNSGGTCIYETAGVMISWPIYVEGLPPGAKRTFQWTHRVANAAATGRLQAGLGGGAVTPMAFMEVIEL